MNYLASLFTTSAQPLAFLASAEAAMEPSTSSLILFGLLVLGVIFLIVLAIAALLIISFWKLFKKAGKPGWASIVPFYNKIVLLELTGKPLWWIVLWCIPGVNIVIAIIVIKRLAHEFGKGNGFVVGLVLLPFIFMPILAFGKASYTSIYPPAPTASDAVKWSLAGLVFYCVIQTLFLSFMAVNQIAQSPSLGEPLTAFDGGYATDGTYVYYLDYVIDNADPSSFRIVGDYGVDVNSVYFHDTPVDGADPSTFHVVPEKDSPYSYYAADNTHVYFSGSAIGVADPQTFETVPGDPYLGYSAKDAKYYYDGPYIVSDAEIKENLRKYNSTNKQ